MVKEAKEAVGSMGDDTPLRYYLIIIGRYILLDKILVKLLIRNNSLRENKVMSLKQDLKFGKYSKL